jgi:hypothetical protein
VKFEADVVILFESFDEAGAEEKLKAMIKSLETTFQGTYCFIDKCYPDE